MLHFTNLHFIDKHSALPESDVPSATQKSSSMSDEDSKGVNDDDCKSLSGKYTTVYQVPLTPKINSEYCHRAMLCIDSL